MTKARTNQISLEDTPYYHCVARCVRRAFLCGEDSMTGQNFDHRKQWVVDKLKELSSVYAIGVCAYAVMSNHYHVVLYVDQKQVESWSEIEVIERWTQLFNGHILVNRYKNNELTSAAEKKKALEIIKEYRSRLMDVTWFMRCLNEFIARQANAEDNCKGRFWEGRFKSQALLDETALLTCMVYVDLNPVRAAIADDLESSDFTSIQERIQVYAEKLDKKRQQRKAIESDTRALLDVAEEEQPDELVKFLGDERQDKQDQHGVYFSATDYLQLVDWTGRAVRNDKRGAIPAHIQPILNKLGVQPEYWADTVEHFGRIFFTSAGSEARLLQTSERLDQRWMRGVGASRRLYAHSSLH